MGDNNENFRLLIRMAMSKEMSWTALSFLFNDMTSTLVKSKIVIEALLEELQTLQGKQCSCKENLGEQSDNTISNKNVNESNDQECLELEGTASLDDFDSNSHEFSLSNDKTKSDHSSKNTNDLQRIENDKKSQNIPSSNQEDEILDENFEDIDVLEANELLSNNEIAKEVHISDEESSDIQDCIDTNEIIVEEKLPLRSCLEVVESVETKTGHLENVTKIEPVVTETEYSPVDTEAEPDEIEIISEEIETGIEAESKSDKEPTDNKKPEIIETEYQFIPNRIFKPLKPYKCNDCSKSYTTISTLNTHKMIHTGLKPYKCAICSKCFYTSENFKRHEKTHTGVNFFQCKNCSKCFSQTSYLKKHERSHSGLKSFQCNDCDKTFRNSASLKSHESIHTQEKPFKCDTCSKSFKQPSNLRIHNMIHTNENPFQCKLCKKTFRVSSGLKSHEITHTEEKPYTCKSCGKTFSRLSTMKNHEIIHTGQKPYQCSICSESFAGSSSWIRHKQIHSSETQFECDICKKEFSIKRYLHRHLKTHKNISPKEVTVATKQEELTGNSLKEKQLFTCKICSQSFTKSLDLKNHLLLDCLNYYSS